METPNRNIEAGAGKTIDEGKINMPDQELVKLNELSAQETTDPLRSPAPSVLNYLASLELTDDDFELLLGEAPGLSWSDMKEDTQAFFFRLRLRTASLVCHDDALKSSVGIAIESGVEACWVALVSAVGLTPDTVVASALKPIAVGLFKSGLAKLCVEGS